MASLFKTILCSFLFTTGLMAAKGSIVGEVYDRSTHQPLVGANIVVLNTDLGAASDQDGHFQIKGLPGGSYHVEASMIGYQKEVKLNVHVVPGRQTSLIFELTISALELETIQVKPSYFRERSEVVTGSRVVDLEEIRSDPGGVYDIQKMMQSLPAVVSGSDQENEIIVRGGAPGENLFIMDEIEIPNPNHFAFQGTGGGPINLINTEFINNVELIAGAFPAQYGGKASSVMDISLREGNRDHPELSMNMGMAGFGFEAEGPFLHRKGSYLASIRKSYLDLVIKNIGLTAVPEYWNAQGKAVYQLNSRHKLIFNGLFGEDAIHIRGGSTPYAGNVENVDTHGQQYSVGMTLKSLWDPELVTLLTVYSNSNHWHTNVFNRRFDQSKEHVYHNYDRERELALKGSLLKRFSRRLEMRSGFQLKMAIVNYDTHSEGSNLNTYYYSTPEHPDLPLSVTSSDIFYTQIFPVISHRDTAWQEGDSVWVAVRGQDTVRTFLVGHEKEYPSWDRNQDGNLMIFQGFASVHWQMLDRLVLNAGFHLYYTDINQQFSLEPRMGLSYQWTSITKLNVAYGVHHQVPAYIYLLGSEGNAGLKNKWTDQIVLGVEHFFGPDIRCTLEIYQKNYHDLIRTNADTSADLYDVYGGYNNEGSGYARGIEFFLQKKLVNRFWGTLSYSHYLARSRDVRFRDRVEYYDWDFDFRNVVTLSSGYKFRFHQQQWYQTLKQKKWWPAVAWLPLAPSDEFELGLRYRYVGGKPYTPKTYDFVHGRWFIDPTAKLNTRRFRPYHRLDIMIIQRNFFEHSSLAVYLDIQNVFDVDNIWDIQYNSDGTTEEVLQFKVFPVGGFVWEF
jgi:hypothetical protein